MITFPNCKINIGLNIVAKRNDGFHDLETIFYPIKKYHDALEIQEAKATQLVVTGTDLKIDVKHNIVYKAFQLLQADYNIPNVHIHLHKNVPHGAGLGGGSADAAFMLQLLNKYFVLNIDDIKLKQYALMLGSDCPFFIDNAPKYAQARGELFEDIQLNLKGYYIVIIKPNIYISTADAFKNIVPTKPIQNLKTLITAPIQNWSNTIINDFEKGIFKLYPSLEIIKNNCYNKGALYASMSGTGSSVYGIFENEIFVRDFELKEATIFVSAL
jgi:4-diphosphocytidyl-2-C-methyl-D-erythritol kinase